MEINATQNPQNQGLCHHRHPVLDDPADGHRGGLADII